LRRDFRSSNWYIIRPRSRGINYLRWAFGSGSVRLGRTFGSWSKYFAGISDSRGLGVGRGENGCESGGEDNKAIITNVVYHRADHITKRITFPYPITLKLQHAFSQLFNIEIQTQETRIILAIKVIRSSKKLNKYRTAKIYKILYTTLSYRIASRTYRPESKTNYYKLTDLKEETIIRYILDLDSRGFVLYLINIKNITNLLLESQGILYISKN
jgi:hypothetical protein